VFQNDGIDRNSDAGVWGEGGEECPSFWGGGAFEEWVVLGLGDFVGGGVGGVDLVELLEEHAGVDFAVASAVLDGIADGTFWDVIVDDYAAGFDLSD